MDHDWSPWKERSDSSGTWWGRMCECWGCPVVEVRDSPPEKPKSKLTVVLRATK